MLQTSAHFIRPRLARCTLRRAYASVSSDFITPARPPPPPTPTPSRRVPLPSTHLPTDEVHHEVDREVLNCLARSNQYALPRLMAQYSANAGHILESQLPHESRPPPQRRVDTTSSDSIVLVAHAYDGPTPEAQAVTLASGFMVEPKPGATEPLFVSCAHTLEQAS